MTETLHLKTMPHNKEALAFIFHRVADCYRYPGEEKRFCAIAYKKVSKLLHYNTPLK